MQSNASVGIDRRFIAIKFSEICHLNKERTPEGSLNLLGRIFIKRMYSNDVLEIMESEKLLLEKNSVNVWVKNFIKR